MAEIRDKCECGLYHRLKTLPLWTNTRMPDYSFAEGWCVDCGTHMKADGSMTLGSQLAADNRAMEAMREGKCVLLAKLLHPSEHPWIANGARSCEDNAYGDDPAAAVAALLAKTEGTEDGK